ncbi:hypothetical protein FRX31_015845 [Thalictrum thalictroides]|uniref:Uncharacterized protein n=1 Tax=Thalictrum thalictroides TaxID=46969 RepID=A0A7J6WB46_THATH|nr:hypothetical protein FRX31_015845 [Thalictrum thalictroides]
MRFVQKLKRLKIDLKAWNSQVFGMVDETIKHLQLEFDGLQFDNDEIYENETLLAAVEQKQLQLQNALSNKACLLKQKSRDKIIKEDSLNTAYFHRLCQIKKERHVMTKIKTEDGILLTEQQDIQSYLVDFFADRVASRPRRINEELMKLIPQVVTEEDNSMLCSVPGNDEIKMVVFP